jgi:hypothetical protein
LPDAGDLPRPASPCVSPSSSISPPPPPTIFNPRFGSEPSSVAGSRFPPDGGHRARFHGYAKEVIAPSLPSATVVPSLMPVASPSSPPIVSLSLRPPPRRRPELAGFLPVAVAPSLLPRSRFLGHILSLRCSSLPQCFVSRLQVVWEFQIRVEGGVDS